MQKGYISIMSINTNLIQQVIWTDVTLKLSTTLRSCNSLNN